MKSEYRGILAIGLSAAFFILWYVVVSPPQKGAPAAEQAPASAETTASPAPAAPVPAPQEAKAEAASQATSADPQAAMPVKSWTIKNGVVEVELTSDGGVPTSWRVLGYRETTDPKSPLIDLASADSGAEPALSLSFEEANFAFPKRPRYELVAADENQAVFRWRSTEAEVVKTITFKPDSYLLDVSVDLKALSSKALTGRPALTWSGVSLPQKDRGFFGFLKQPPDNKVPVYYFDGKVHREADTAKLAPRTDKQGQLMWAGLESRYFIGAVIPRVQGQGLSVEYGAEGLPGQVAGARELFAGAALPSVTAPSGDAVRSLFSAYAGPKEIGQLKGAGVKLEEAIDYGWFTVIAIPILYCLKFFYGLIHNYGVAIILLTIFVKLLLHPINVKSLKSMKAMQQLQPRLKELQKKYADEDRKSTRLNSSH